MPWNKNVKKNEGFRDERTDWTLFIETGASWELLTHLKSFGSCFPWKKSWIHKNESWEFIYKYKDKDEWADLGKKMFNLTFNNHSVINYDNI